MPRCEVGKTSFVSARITTLDDMLMNTIATQPSGTAQPGPVFDPQLDRQLLQPVAGLALAVDQELPLGVGRGDPGKGAQQ